MQSGDIASERILAHSLERLEDPAAVALGMLSSSFSADRATCSVQGMEELVQAHELTAGVLGACAPKRPDILHRGRDGGEARVDVCAKSLAHQFRPGAVLGLEDLLDLLHHFSWERDGHCLSRSHSPSPV